MEQYSKLNTQMKAVLALILVLSVVYICVIKQNIEPLIALAGTAVGYYFGKQSQSPSSDTPTKIINTIDTGGNIDEKIG